MIAVLSRKNTISLKSFLIIFLAVFLAQHFAAATAGCLKELFGQPAPKDCRDLLATFADFHDDQARLFDEEQLRTDSEWNFPGIHNELPTAAMQIPAFWSLRSCNMGLVSYAPEPNDHTPLSVTSWSKIRLAGEGMMSRCMSRAINSQGGSAIVPGYHNPQPVLTLFIWHSNTVFNALINEMQNDPFVVPPPIQAVTGSMAGNYTSAFAAVAAAVNGSGSDSLNITNLANSTNLVLGGSHVTAEAAQRATAKRDELEGSVGAEVEGVGSRMSGVEKRKWKDRWEALRPRKASMA